MTAIVLPPSRPHDPEAQVPSSSPFSRWGNRSLEVESLAQVRAASQRQNRALNPVSGHKPGGLLLSAPSWPAGCAPPWLLWGWGGGPWRGRPLSSPEVPGFRTGPSVPRHTAGPQFTSSMRSATLSETTCNEASLDLRKWMRVRVEFLQYVIGVIMTRRRSRTLCAAVSGAASEAGGPWRQPKRCLDSLRP